MPVSHLHYGLFGLNRFACWCRGCFPLGCITSISVAPFLLAWPPHGRDRRGGHFRGPVCAGACAGGCQSHDVIAASLHHVIAQLFGYDHEPCRRRLGGQLFRVRYITGPRCSLQTGCSAGGSAGSGRGHCNFLASHGTIGRLLCTQWSCSSPLSCAALPTGRG